MYFRQCLHRFSRDFVSVGAFVQQGRFRKCILDNVCIDFLVILSQLELLCSKEGSETVF